MTNIIIYDEDSSRGEKNNIAIYTYIFYDQQILPFVTMELVLQLDHLF